MPSMSIEGRAIRKTAGVVGCIGRTMLHPAAGVVLRRYKLGSRRGACATSGAIGIGPQSTSNGSQNIVEARELRRRFGEGEAAVDALRA